MLRDEEDTASQLLPLLNLLRPSAACTEAVVPFLCVFLFGLCDSSGVSIQPTSVQCEQIRDVLCPDQWRQAALVVDLPDCSSFPTEQAECPVASGDNSDENGLDGSGSGSLSNIISKWVAQYNCKVVDREKKLGCVTIASPPGSLILLKEPPPPPPPPPPHTHTHTHTHTQPGNRAK